MGDLSRVEMGFKFTTQYLNNVFSIICGIKKVVKVDILFTWRHYNGIITTILLLKCLQGIQNCDRNPHG